MELLAELDVHSMTAAKAVGGAGGGGAAGTSGGGGGQAANAAVVVATATGAGDGRGDTEDEVSPVMFFIPYVGQMRSLLICR